MYYLFNAFLSAFVSIVLGFATLEYMPGELKSPISGLVLVVGGLVALWNLYLLVCQLVHRRK